MIYLSADSHLGHYKLSDPKFTPNPRPDNFTTEILMGLARYAKPENSLIHLGDILISDKARRKHLYACLKASMEGYGHRTLIRGNHDRQGDAFYHSLGFDSVVSGSLKMGNVILSHQPLVAAQSRNIHGHCHGKSELDKRRYSDISPEVVGYDPVPLELIIANL